MNSQHRPVSLGGSTAAAISTTGAYAAEAASAISQTNEDAPATEACLLNRFQVACATAATRIKARAVALTGSAPRSGPGTQPGHGEREPSRFLSRQVWVPQAGTP